MQEYDLFTSTVKVRHQDLRLCVFLHQPAIMRVIGMIAIRRTFREGNVIFLRFPRTGQSSDNSAFRNRQRSLPSATERHQGPDMTIERGIFSWPVTWEQSPSYEE
jgi:hypothetical protein